MIVEILVEGGSKSSLVDCHRAFTQFFRKCGFGRGLRIIPSGGRDEVWKDFLLSQSKPRPGVFVCFLTDSDKSGPIPKNVWAYIGRENTKPENAIDDQVLLMVTSMESWILADRVALRSHYGRCINESVLLAYRDLEVSLAVVDCLRNSTVECEDRRYSKGSKSFELFEKIDPKILIRNKINSFKRVHKILDSRLRGNDTLASS